jgi:hypothetical protein
MAAARTVDGRGLSAYAIARGDGNGGNVRANWSDNGIPSPTAGSPGAAVAELAGQRQAALTNSFVSCF